MRFLPILSTLCILNAISEGSLIINNTLSEKITEIQPAVSTVKWNVNKNQKYASWVLLPVHQIVEQFGYSPCNEESIRNLETAVDSLLDDEQSWIAYYDIAKMDGLCKYRLLHYDYPYYMLEKIQMIGGDGVVVSGIGMYASQFIPPGVNVDENTVNGLKIEKIGLVIDAPIDALMETDNRNLSEFTFIQVQQFEPDNNPWAGKCAFNVILSNSLSLYYHIY